MFTRKTLPLSTKGFTLIELLVVISLLTFLLSVILPQLSTLQQKGRDSARISTAQQIKNAMDIYWASHFRYPLPDDGGGDSCIWLSGWSEIEEVMGGPIKDPLWADQNFRYCSPTSATHPNYGNAYGVLVRLEEEERRVYPPGTPADKSGEVNLHGYCKTGIKVPELDTYSNIWNEPDFVPECNF